MYAENASVVKTNEVVLNDLPGELYTKEANDIFPDNYKYPLVTIRAAQNQKQSNAGGLTKLLKLTAGGKVMLRVNSDIQDRLINGETGNNR